MLIRERMESLRGTNEVVNEFTISGKIQSMTFDGTVTKVCLKTVRAAMLRTGVREVRYFPNFIIKGAAALEVVTKMKKYDGIEFKGHLETLPLPDGKNFAQMYVVDSYYPVAQNYAEDVNYVLVRGRISDIKKKDKVNIVCLEAMQNSNETVANIRFACFGNIKKFVDSHCETGKMVTVNCYIDTKRVVKLKDVDEYKERKIVDWQNLAASEITCD